MTYSSWLLEQSIERQSESTQIMMVCRRNGEAQRQGDWAEAERLRLEIRSYNERYLHVV